MKRLAGGLLLIALIFVLILTGARARNHGDVGAVSIATAVTVETDTVVRVHDGDTFYTVKHPGGVRLIGADTPEVTNNSHGRIGCWAKPATDRAKGLLPVGSPVQLTLGGTSYNRVLADVTNHDGVNVARTLIAEGLATVEIVKPNVEHETDYRAVLAQAQTARLGEWSVTNPPGAPAGCVNPPQPKGS